MPRRGTGLDPAQVVTRRPSGEARGPSRRSSVAGATLRGRASYERGARRRVAIAEALLELLPECDSLPTALGLAGCAGVSVRLVFHHYRDMEAVYEAAFELLNGRHWDRVPKIAPDLPLRVRVDRTVKERAILFEAIAPLRRAALMLPQHRSSIVHCMDAEDHRLRQWLSFTFEPELTAVGRTRSDSLHALELVASCEAWNRLRRNQGRSVRAASRTMGSCLEALLISSEVRRR